MLDKLNYYGLSKDDVMDSLPEFQFVVEKDSVLVGMYYRICLYCTVHLMSIFTFSLSMCVR